MHRKVALLGAVIGWLAIVLQMCLTVWNSLVAGHGIGHGLVMFFGFFTVTTNIFMALVLSAHLARTSAPFWEFFRRPLVATGATACMIVVGITYFLLLRRLWNPQGLQYIVDVSLHYIMPIITVIFWWLTIPGGTVQWSAIGRMLVYPLVYLVYVFVRAPLVGSYPYFFIDVNAFGMERALLNAAWMALFFVLVCTVLVAINRRRVPA